MLHAEFEALTNGFMIRRRIMYVLVLAIIGVIAYDFWRIDSCLDSGGKWDPEKKFCEAILKKSQQSGSEKK